ncbi:MAG: serine/threonine protein kinase [Blastopirellula sp.]|nr:MAG: serine/threonine protein kinase [Blastopirellula sp.]
MRILTGFILLLATSSLLISPVSAEDWTLFRGPSSYGASAATDLPTQWDGKKNILWKTELPGPGASSPVVLGDHIYVTSFSGYGMNEDEPGEKKELKRHLICVDRTTGKVIWDKSIDADPEIEEKNFSGFVALHGYASSTPAVDKSGVYVFFGTGGAAAFGHDGKLKWNVPCGTKTHGFGTANSPVIYKNTVIINASVESGAIIGLSKKNGEELWRWEGVEKSWNTPILVQANGKDELVFNTKKTVRALAPSNGEELWTCEAMDDYICPSVIHHNGIVYAIGARKNATVAIRTGGRGDVTDTHIVWQNNKGSNVSSPAYFEGHLYWASEGKGIAYCADAETGDIVYEERMDPRPDRIYASPIVADGKVYYMSRTKGAFVVAAKPEYEMLSHNVIEDDSSVFNGSPAVVDGKIYLRSNQALYCIGQ